MDPLSICASAVALIGTSKAVTKALYSFTRYATHAETHVASLCSEIATLTEFLSSIDTTLKSCRRNARAFALIDAELWCQSDLALQDCEATLKELSAFVARLRPSNEKSKTAFWRAKVAVDMSIHGRQLEQFRTRLQRSNYALQTVLQTVTVSVSVQNNASQDRLMLELDKLKVYIEHAVSIGARSPVGSRRQPTATTLSDTVAAKHLQGLVKAAESFYSNATSTVGSSFGGSVAADWPPPARETIPGLSSFRTQRVHEYIQSTSRRMRPPAAAEAKDWHEYSIMDESAELTDNTAKPMTGAPDADCKLPLIGDLGYFDLERTMIEVREDYAVEKMKVGDFEGAVSFLSEALSKLESFCETQVRMRLQTRLGMCYVLQRKAHAACKVVSELERNGGLENREVLHLMHALVMLYVAQSELGRADDLGHKIVNAKMRLLGKSHPETLMTLGFLERMYCNFTMLLRLVAIRRHIPPDYVYSHPESELDFLTRHAMLMPAVVIETDKVELPGTPVLEDSAQTAGKGDTPSCDVKRALGRYERQPTDTTRPFESQPTDTMKTFVSISVIQPDDAAPNKRSSVRNGQRLLLVSRSMTTIRRHLSTWRPLSSRVERHGRDASEGPNTGRCRTVLHKAPPASRMEPAGSTRLVRARKFLSMMKKEMPTVGVPAENFPVVFELDSRCISREDHARQLSAAHGGSVASTADVAGREPRRVSGRPLNTSLGVIVELPELDSGDAYGLKSQAAAATEESEKSEKSSASSLSRGSSLSDNHSSVSGSICSGSTCSGSTYNGSTYSGSTCSGSTCSGSSYSSNTTIPSGAAASCVGEGQCDDSPALRSMSQRHRAVRLVKNGSFSSVHRSRASMPCSTRFSLLSSIRRHDSTHELKGRRATHPAMGCPSKACRPVCLPGTSPTVDTGRNSDGRGRQARPAGADVQMAVNGWGGGLQDGPEQAAAEQRHGLKRTFSWSYGDERCFLVKVARKEPHCSVA